MTWFQKKTNTTWLAAAPLLAASQTEGTAKTATSHPPHRCGRSHPPPANTAWAFAEIGVWQEEFLREIAGGALERLGVPQEELLGAIAGRYFGEARGAQPAVRLDAFNPQNLANTAPAFATLGSPQEEVVRGFADMEQLVNR